jgi:hypothetical protein
MSEYNHEYFINSFVERTQKNYEQILNLKAKKQEVFEVTQLINSLFGLLILPFEKFRYKSSKEDCATEKNLKFNASSEYEEIEKLMKQLKEEQRLVSTYNSRENDFPVSSFVKHLRNAIAHSGETGLQFLPYDESGEITEVYFCDEDKSNNDREYFCVKMTINEIRSLVNNISSMYRKYESRPVDDKTRKHRKEQIGNQIKRYESLLKQK